MILGRARQVAGAQAVHVALVCASEGRPFAWDLVEGAKGVQLANLALRSSAEGRRLEVPPLAV